MWSLRHKVPGGTWLAGLCMLAGATARAQTSAMTIAVAGAEPLRACVAAAGGTHGEVDSVLGGCLRELRREGYLEASVDEVYVSGDTVHVRAHLGAVYRLGALVRGVDSSREQGAVAYDTLPEPRGLADLVPAARAYVRDRGREGYPFARVRFGELRVDGPSLNGEAAAWSGPRVTYAGLRFPGETPPPVSVAYLQRRLRVEPGRTFYADDVARVERRLRGIGFLDVRSPPTVTFERGLAHVTVDAEARNASRFDFLLGFLPNSAANDGQLLLTGDLTLELENALRRGERLYVSFERLRPESTEAAVEAEYPYLLDSPFGARGRFSLLRQADEWLRVGYEAGATYAFGGGDAYELYYEGAQAQVLGFDTAAAQRTQRLPDVLDATRNGFGVRLRLDRRDDAFATRSGWRARVEGSAALREVSVPGSVRDLGDVLDARADTAAGATGQYRAALDAGAYVPTGPRTTLALLARGALVAGAQTPLRNELFLIGGNRLLRGFDEQSVQASAYAVATAEYRLLVGGGSYLFAFADQALVRDPYRRGDRADAPTGFGAGLRLATGAGALSLSYAYGRRAGAPVEWDRAKVHVGYASRF